LNAIQHFTGFIYQEVEVRQGQPQAIDIRLQPHEGMRGKCSQCQQPAPDRLEERGWLHVPLWGIPTYFCYAPRRVECPEHGIVVEEIPWSQGKRPVTQMTMGILGALDTAAELEGNGGGIQNQLGKWLRILIVFADKIPFQ
jgi:hypothetical protein